MTQCDQCSMSLWDLILIKESTESSLDSFFSYQRWQPHHQWPLPPLGSMMLRVFNAFSEKRTPWFLCTSSLHPALSFWACTSSSFKTVRRTWGGVRTPAHAGLSRARPLPCWRWRHSCHSWSSLEKHEVNHTSSFYRILTDQLTTGCFFSSEFARISGGGEEGAEKGVRKLRAEAAESIIVEPWSSWCWYSPGRVVSANFIRVW